MHILDVWLEQLKVFYPENLKIFVSGIVRQLDSLFKFLFVNWWPLSWFLLFSPGLMYGFASLTNSHILLSIMQVTIMGAYAYFGFLAVLFAVPTEHSKLPGYIENRQSLFWPIVTPYVLWYFFNWHLFKFLSLILTPIIMHQAVKYSSFVLLVSIGWLASPLFVFFAFIIIETNARHGIWHALEYAFGMLWHTYPLCVCMFACLWGLRELLEYALTTLTFINPWLQILFNPIVIMIPCAVVLFGGVYRWYEELV